MTLLPASLRPLALLCSLRWVWCDDDPFVLDLDSAIEALEKFKDRHADRRQEAKTDVEVHRRTVTSLPASEHFAKSTQPRQRANNPDVKFEVGQVVGHKLWGYTAVIIGWDEILKAPESWTQHMHKNAPKSSDPVSWRTMPNYSVLVVRGSSGLGDTRYVPQVNIRQLTGAEARVESADLDEFFQGFDEECSQFLAKPWLRERYPEDRGCLAARAGGASYASAARTEL